MLKTKKCYKHVIVNYFCSPFLFKNVKSCTLSIKLNTLSIFFLVDKIKLSTFELLNKIKQSLKPQIMKPKSNKKTPKIMCIPGIMKENRHLNEFLGCL